MFRGLAQISFLFFLTIGLAACDGGHKGGGGGGGSAAQVDTPDQDTITYEACVSDIDEKLAALGLAEENTIAFLNIVTGDKYSYMNGEYLGVKDLSRHLLYFKLNRDGVDPLEGLIAITFPDLIADSYLMQKNCMTSSAQISGDGTELFFPTGPVDSIQFHAVLEGIFSTQAGTGTLDWYTTEDGNIVIVYISGDFIVVLYKPVY